MLFRKSELCLRKSELTDFDLCHFDNMLHVRCMVTDEQASFCTKGCASPGSDLSFTDLRQARV